jgi:hypothetical protein
MITDTDEAADWRSRVADHHDQLAHVPGQRRVAIAKRTAKARALAQASRIAKADAYATKVLPIIREAQKAGATSLRDIAEVLTAWGVPTQRSGRWHAVSVKNVLDRMGTPRSQRKTLRKAGI